MSLADRYAEPLLVYCSADECRLTRPKLKADASGALWCDEHFPAAAPSLPAAAPDVNRGPWTDERLRLFAESIHGQTRLFARVILSLRSTLDARDAEAEAFR